MSKKKTFEASAENLVKKIEKETGRPAQLIIIQPNKTCTCMKSKVVGALADRKPLTVKLFKHYQDWSTHEMVDAPTEWKSLNGCTFDSISDIIDTIERKKLYYMSAHDIEFKECPDEPGQYVFRCPQCGSYGNETVNRPGDNTFETYKCGWNYAPPSRWVLCQKCCARAPDLGPLSDLKVIGSDLHGHVLAIDGPNLGSGGGPTFITVGKIVYPLLTRTRRTRKHKK